MVGDYGRDVRTALGAMLQAAGVEADPQCIDRFTEFEKRTWEDAAIIYPDVRSALERLCAHGVQLVLVSNCCFLTPPLLDAWDLRRYFVEVVLSCELRCVKPDPAIFRYAFTAIDSHPKRGVIVDDNPEYVDAARRLGLAGRQIARGQPSSASGVISDLTQLADELRASGPLH
jgi:HAD superfamily hydrolase (TIGR01509 family)